MTPIGILEHLVDEQNPSSSIDEFSGEINQIGLCEIEVVHVDIQARTVCSELLFGILQEEGGFAYTSGALDAD